MLKKLEKLYNREDAQKWAHPEIEAQYAFYKSGTDPIINVIYNQSVPLEERRSIAANNYETMFKAYAEANPEAMSRRELYTATGCPEEPDTEVEIVVYRPAKPAKKKLPAIYAVPGGGMFCVMLEMGGLDTFADKYNCVVVAP